MARRAHLLVATNSASASPRLARRAARNGRTLSFLAFDQLTLCPAHHLTPATAAPV